ncbi:MAG: hypothetical protein Q7R47_00850, partial [Candidatus Diapherotrites archaeon]|nr:hypothetical protein [Candidatus Diapherotrites archaeon]
MLGLSPVVFASFITLSTVGGPFVADSNILIIGHVYDNNGSAKNNVDVNSFVLSDSNVATDLNYFGSVQGAFFRVIVLAQAGDYNVIARDLNNGVSASVRISVRSVKRAAITFNPHNPPFDKSASEDINFSLQGKNAADADTNVILSVRLLSDANASQAASPIDVNANGRDQNVFDTAGLPPGMYFIDVNNGLSLFPVPVFQFKGFLDLKDDQNSSITVFGPGKTVFVYAKATNFDGNVSQTISDLNAFVRTPSGAISSLNSTCSSGIQRVCTYAIPENATAGDYTVTMVITVGADVLTVRRAFSVQTYQLNFYTKKFGGGDSAMEKMPSVYPANSTVSFEAHFLNTADGNDLSGSDLNYRFCQDQNLTMTIQKAGSADMNAIGYTPVFSSITPNYCLVNLRAPAQQGTYTVTAQANYNGQTLRKSTVLVIQNYLIFSRPVSPSTYDPATPTGKFVFYKGESVGFAPSYVDLNGSLNPSISAVSQIRVFDSGGMKTFTGSDINWNSDKNILVLNASGVNTLSGGFKPVEMTVDVNAADANATGITAFGVFKLNLLSLSAIIVDSNVALTATQKSEQFGPPAVGLDENIYIKVTALTGGGSGISGATVRLKSMRNMDTWSEVSASGIASRVTDSNGVAILGVGKLSTLGVGSGGYLTEISVETADGNTDSTEMFFDSRRFAAF